MRIQITVFLASSLLLLFCSASSAQTKIADITFPNSFIAGKDHLVLNGGGVRKKYWMEMYVAGLYLTSKSKDPDEIVASNSSMAIRICILSSLISSEKMREAVEEGFKKSTNDNTIAYKDKISKFQNAFSEPIKVGDVFDIVYTAEAILIYKNNLLKIEIPGLDFKKVVFGIWLGKNPADENIKAGMLGTTD